MDKYRIRLANSRVVGPFNQNQILELYAKGHIDGTEECQLFPTGEWLKVLDFENLAGIFNQELKTQTFDNSTVIKKLADVTGSNNQQNKNSTSITASDFQDEVNQLNNLENQIKDTSTSSNEDPNFPQEFSYKNLANKEPSRVDIPLPEKKVPEVKIQKPVAEPVKIQVDDGEITVVI